MTDDLEKLRKEAIEENRCFSKSRLKDEFRMKPKSDAEPVKYYKNEFAKNFLFTVSLIVSLCAKLKQVDLKSRTYLPSV